VNLEVRVRTLTPQVAAVELIGEADIYTTYLAKEAMLKLLEAGARHLVIDLKGADYLDSTALGLLVGMLKRVREREGSLRLVGPKARVRKVFEITRLDQVFPIFESEAEAIAGIAQEEKP
jgi:anti-sigma B factor antagonist